MRKQHTFTGAYFFAFCLAASLLTAPQSVHAQATPTAKKDGEISAFAGYTRYWPDFGPDLNNGASFGLDYSHFLRNWLITPSIEVRGKFANGNTVDMYTWGGGIRLDHTFGRFRPFVDYQFAKGTLHFKFININQQGRPETGNDAFVFSPGFGLDYDFHRSFAARIDFRPEYWEFGNSQSLKPRAISAGIVYRFHFGRFW